MDDALDGQVFALEMLIEDWRRKKPAFDRLADKYVAAFDLEQGGKRAMPAELRKEYKLELGLIADLEQRLEDAANPVLLFGDRNGIDMMPVVRLLHTEERRLPDMQAIRDCFGMFDFANPRPEPPPQPAGPSSF